MYTKDSDVPAPDLAATATAAYSPIASVESRVVRDESLEATVIVLSGLEEIPEGNLVGWTGSQVEDSGFFVTTRNTF